jgi:hypothetical protein
MKQELCSEKSDGKVSLVKSSPNKIKKEVESKNEVLIDLTDEGVVEKKRKREEEELSSVTTKESEDKASTNVIDESDRVVEYKVTNIRSSIKKKMPFEDETVSTVVTESVSISSPIRSRSTGSESSIKKKLPLEDDEVITITGLHSKIALKSDTGPPWWFNLATDIGEDIINILKKGKVDKE